MHGEVGTEKTQMTRKKKRRRKRNMAKQGRKRTAPETEKRSKQIESAKPRRDWDDAGESESVPFLPLKTVTTRQKTRAGRAGQRK